MNSSKKSLLLVALIAMGAGACVVAGPLHDAIKDGDIELVKKLLDNGADIEEVVNVGNVFEATLERIYLRKDDTLTPLGQAVVLGNLDMVKLLVEKGARPISERNSADDLAIITGRLDILQALFPNGIKNSVTYQEMGRLLFGAIDFEKFEIATWLLKNGADINSGFDRHGENVLYTVFSQDIELTEGLRFLLKNGVDVNIPSKIGSKLIHRAATSQFINLIRILCSKGADVNSKNMVSAGGLMPLHRAVIASDKGVSAAASCLLELGAKVNDVDNYNQTPLYHAVAKYFKNVVKLLLKHNANPNIANIDLNTPLHIAVKDGRKDLVKLLLDAGVNPKLKNKAGQTALDIALSRQNPDLEIINMLQDAMDFENKTGFITNKNQAITTIFTETTCKSGYPKIAFNKLVESCDIDALNYFCKLLTKNGVWQQYVADEQLRKEFAGKDLPLKQFKKYVGALLAKDPDLFKGIMNDKQRSEKCIEYGLLDEKKAQTNCFDKIIAFDKSLNLCNNAICPQGRLVEMSSYSNLRALAKKALSESMLRKTEANTQMYADVVIRTNSEQK